MKKKLIKKFTIVIDDSLLGIGVKASVGINRDPKFKDAIKNILMMQNNNDTNFQILQRQIDDLQRQLTELNDLKEMFRLPKPENKDRKVFDETD